MSAFPFFPKTSATLDSARFAAYFGAGTPVIICSCISSSRRSGSSNGINS